MKKKYKLSFDLILDEDTKKDSGYDHERVFHLINSLRTELNMKKMYYLSLKKSAPSRKHYLYHVDKDLKIINQMIDSYSLKYIKD
jgi:hypothetical protein